MQLQIFDVLHSFPDERQKSTPKSALKSIIKIFLWFEFVVSLRLSFHTRTLKRQKL